MLRIPGSDPIQPARLETLLIIEPYFGGSHKQLIDTVISGLRIQELAYVVTLPAKKWHWRARTGALRMSQQIPLQHSFKYMLASSVLNLAELTALRPDIGKLYKIIYFHENQMVYPVRKSQERDFQYGYNQILSCMVADKVVFNSKFNRKSFLDNISKFLKLQPDCRPVGIPDQISPKCCVLYFPIDLDSIINSCGNHLHEGPLHIVWPHRWEHDKDPETFISVILKLLNAGMEFKISMLGQSSKDVPQSIIDARDKLGSKVSAWGYLESREDYLAELRKADVVVSTALHEFFGVSMIEAIATGCYPLCPNRLVYPEFYPAQCLYKTPEDLYQLLMDFCKHPEKPRSGVPKLHIDLQRFNTPELLPKYKDLLFPEHYLKTRNMYLIS